MFCWIILILVTCSSVTGKTCPVGWRMFGNSCYYFSKHVEPWSSSAFLCKNLDTSAHLVEVETVEESDYLANVARNKVYLGCFNDGYDRTMNGAFLDLEATMDNGACLAYCRSRGFRYAGTQYRRQCFCDDAVSHYWRTNNSHCHLTCAGDETDICGGHWRLSVYETAGRRYWLGGTDMIEEGKWHWFTSKREFQFTAWMNGTENNEYSPEFGRSSEDCLNLDPNKSDVFRWNDENCQEPHYFICEKPVDQ